MGLAMDGVALRSKRDAGVSRVLHPLIQGFTVQIQARPGFASKASASRFIVRAGDAKPARHLPVRQEEAKMRKQFRQTKKDRLSPVSLF